MTRPLKCPMRVALTNALQGLLPQASHAQPSTAGRVKPAQSPLSYSRGSFALRSVPRVRGAALQAMITDESLTVSEAVQWCAGAIGHREAARLRGGRAGHNNRPENDSTRAADIR